jgi:hypothetical protein
MRRKYERHGLTNSRSERVYFHLSHRCNNKNNKGYSRYGGRGIKCLWPKFEDFRRDMYQSYIAHVEKHGEKNTSIDRIDNDGPYSKGNCRWATRVTQNQNRSNVITLTYQGKTMILSEWAKELGVQRGTLQWRYHAGWPVERILAPIRPHKKYEWK